MLLPHRTRSVQDSWRQLSLKCAIEYCKWITKMVCKACYAKYHWRTRCSFDQNGKTLVLNLPLDQAAPNHELLQYPSEHFKCIPKYSAKIQQLQSKVQTLLTPADITDNTTVQLLEAKIPFQPFLPSNLSSSLPWISTATTIIKTQPSLDLLCALTQ